MIIQRPGQKINFVPGIGINVITPMSAAALWYLQGGIPAANCKAAYRSISTPGSPWGAGPASYADSKINLAKPGTYDATEGNAPAWSAATGWMFNNKYLKTGVIPGPNWSIIVRFSDASLTTSQTLTGELAANASLFLDNCDLNANSRRYVGGNGSIIVNSGKVTSGVMCIAGNDCYYNGVFDGTMAGYSWTGTAIEIYIGGRNLGPALNRPCLAYIQAEAIYDYKLTFDQQLALYAAIVTL